MNHTDPLKAAIEALQTLVDLYVANQGTDHEFISCKTPKHASAMTPAARRKCEVWSAWDNARAVLTAQSAAAPQQAQALTEDDQCRASCTVCGDENGNEWPCAKQRGRKRATLSQQAKEQEARCRCYHSRTVTHHTGDGTPIEFCPECGKNVGVSRAEAQAKPQQSNNGPSSTACDDQLASGEGRR